MTELGVRSPLDTARQDYKILDYGVAHACLQTLGTGMTSLYFLSKTSLKYYGLQVV